jgi:hypothetical protein
LNTILVILMSVLMCLLQPDPLLYFLEELGGSDGGFQSEEEAAAPSQTTFNGLGGDLELADGEITTATSVVGPPAADVGSIYELILSEHQYYKAEEPAVCVDPLATAATTTTTSLIAPSSSPVIVATTHGQGAELVLPATLPSPTTQIVVVSRPAPALAATRAAPVVTPATSSVGGTAGLSSSSGRSASDRAALTRMVNPNDVCSPRLARQDSEEGDAGLLQDLASMLQDSGDVESILSDEDIRQFLQFPPIPTPNLDQAAATVSPPLQQQQNVITASVVSTPATATTPKCNNSGRKRKQPSSSTPVTVSKLPVTPVISIPEIPSLTVHVPDMSSVCFDFESAPLDDDCQRSPDSGCSSMESDSPSSPHSSHDDDPLAMESYNFDWNSNVFSSLDDFITLD